MPVKRKYTWESVEDALEQIGHLVPKDEQWQSAAGCLEKLAEILDAHELPRPATSKFVIS